MNTSEADLTVWLATATTEQRTEIIEKYKNDIERHTQAIIDTANRIILIANHKEPVHIAGFKKS